MSKYPTGPFCCIFIVFLVLFGCANIRKSAIKLSESDIKNAEVTVKVAQNLLESWPVWSGAMRAAMQSSFYELPQTAVIAWNELDALSCRHCTEKWPIEIRDKYECEPTGPLSWYDFGSTMGYRILLLADIVVDAVKKLVPDLLKKLPFPLVL